MVSVYRIRPICVMLRAKVDGEAVGFADLAPTIAKEHMMFLYVRIFAIALIYSRTYPALSVFRLHDAGGVFVAFLFGLWFREFNHVLSVHAL